MEELKDKTSDLANHVEDLANTFYRLTVINATQKATNFASGLIALIAICTFGFLVLLFTGIALSLWLGKILDSQVGGFLLGALFFLIIMFTIAALRKKIIFPFIRNRLIKKIYE